MSLCHAIARYSKCACVWGCRRLLDCSLTYVCTSLTASESRCRNYYWHSHTQQELQQVWKVWRRQGGEEQKVGGEEEGVEGRRSGGDG